ncbi:hypothetical protein [Nonomuraea dietziae]|uniref:hypothetical protein n=1 Tax=Nonomuraea dietziae TaxID=65515 RepID=UPI0031D535CE
MLFSGDHVLAKITPMVAVHPQSTPNPLADYLEALVAVRKFEVDEVLPAHEYRFKELAERVDYVIGHHEDRLEEIAEVIGADDASPAGTSPPGSPGRGRGSRSSRSCGARQTTRPSPTWPGWRPRGGCAGPTGEAIFGIPCKASRKN